MTDKPDNMTLPTVSEENLRGLDLATLREFRNELTAEEEKVSYWRRLVQGRLNLIETQKKADNLTARDLLRSLGETGTGHRRQQLLSVDAHAELPQLPGLDELWTSAIDPSDEEGTRLLCEALNDAEKQLSSYRRDLHRRIDMATAELIERYKADPNLSLQLFPEDVR